jgi:hypothetical protein
MRDMPSAVEYLDLLAREAAPVEFERPLIAARAAGVSGAELAELERIKVLALRVRALLEGSTTPPVTWPACVIWTRCCGPSCTGPGPCSTPTCRT